MPKIVLKQSSKGKTNTSKQTKQGVTIYLNNVTPVLKPHGSTMTITTPAKLLKTNKK